MAPKDDKDKKKKKGKKEEEVPVAPPRRPRAPPKGPSGYSVGYGAEGWRTVVLKNRRPVIPAPPGSFRTSGPEGHYAVPREPAFAVTDPRYQQWKKAIPRPRPVIYDPRGTPKPDGHYAVPRVPAVAIHQQPEPHYAVPVKRPAAKRSNEAPKKFVLIPQEWDRLPKRTEPTPSQRESMAHIQELSDMFREDREDARRRAATKPPLKGIKKLLDKMKTKRGPKRGSKCSSDEGSSGLPPPKGPPPPPPGNPPSYWKQPVKH